MLKAKLLPVDNSDMANSQDKFFGVHSYNVKADMPVIPNPVTVSLNHANIDTSVNQAFMASAPNMPFRLPFHLEHIFGCHDADKETT